MLNSEMAFAKDLKKEKPVKGNFLSAKEKKFGVEGIIQLIFFNSGLSRPLWGLFPFSWYIVILQV